MGGKKKKSKKSKKSEDDDGEKEGANAEALPTSLDNYVYLDFRMLNWKYMNFVQKFRDTTHIFTLKRLLTERHGRVGDMKICFDAYSEANEVKDEMMTIKDCGIKGRQPNMIPDEENGGHKIEEGSIPTVQVFYDFKPIDYSDPVMLYFNS
jgi:hypothetical protein